MVDEIQKIEDAARAELLHCQLDVVRLLKKDTIISLYRECVDVLNETTAARNGKILYKFILLYFKGALHVLFFHIIMII